MSQENVETVALDATTAGSRTTWDWTGSNRTSRWSSLTRFLEPRRPTALTRSGLYGELRQVLGRRPLRRRGVHRLRRSASSSPPAWSDEARRVACDVTRTWAGFVWIREETAPCEWRLRRPRRGPRSRGAGGVGDVAGERGDRASGLIEAANAGTGAGPHRDRSAARARLVDSEAPDSGVYAGMRDGVVVCERLGEGSSDLRFDVTEIGRRTATTVITLARLLGRGREGVEVERAGTGVWTLRDGNDCSQAVPSERKPSKPRAWRSRRCRRRT